jgi:ketosteroid isomerase-like protein
MGSPAEHVRSFYAALDAGDVDRAARHLAEAATDDRGEQGAVTGADAIARARLDPTAVPAASWTLERLVDEGEQVAVELTVTWRDPETGDREGERDSEWLTLNDGLIVEIRSYRGADEHDDGPTLTDEDFDWSLLETGDE